LGMMHASLLGEGVAFDSPLFHRNELSFWSISRILKLFFIP